MMEDILPKFGCLQESAILIIIRNLLSLKPIMLLCPYVYYVPLFQLLSHAKENNISSKNAPTVTYSANQTSSNEIVSKSISLQTLATVGALRCHLVDVLRWLIFSPTSLAFVSVLTEVQNSSGSSINPNAVSRHFGTPLASTRRVCLVSMTNCQTALKTVSLWHASGCSNFLDAIGYPAPNLMDGLSEAKPIVDMKILRHIGSWSTITASLDGTAAPTGNLRFARGF